MSGMLLNPFISFSLPSWWDNTVLYLPMDGEDEGTTFTDESPVGRTITANGGVNTEQSIKKYGSAAGEFTGSTPYLSTADSADWDLGTAPATVAFWVRFTSMSANPVAIVGEGRGFSGVGPRETGWRVIYNDSASQLAFSRYDGGTDESKLVTWSASVGVWYHVAIVRDGNSLYFFVDGVQVGATQTVTGISYNRAEANGVYIGYHETGGGPTIVYLDGVIDDLIVVKGTAIWTSNFTPPTGPHNKQGSY